MKVLHLVVVLGVLAATHCLPAPKNHTEVPEQIDFVPLEDSDPGFRGVVDIGSGDDFFGNPFGQNPFPNLFSSIEEIMGRMRQQLSQILGRLPTKSGDSPFPELHIPQIGDIDLGKGNTTSVTKVINGHKVTINETKYSKDGANDSASFFVRVVDIHPDGDSDSTEMPHNRDAEIIPAKKNDPESIETLSNEIPNVRDNEELSFDNIETFDDADLVPPFKQNVQRNAEWDNVRSVETIEDNSIDVFPQPIYDLSNDIRVNQLLADSGAKPNPDAEIFDPRQNFPQPSPGINYYEPIRTQPNSAPFFLPPVRHYYPAQQPFPQYYPQPEPFPYPNFPFDNRQLKAQREEFENLERIQTNDVFPKHQNSLLENDDLPKTEKHKNKKFPTEIINQQSSSASLPSVPLTQKNSPNLNVPVTSS